MSRQGAGSAVIMAVVSCALAAAAWQWRAQVFSTERAGVDREAWDGIKEEFPLPKEDRPALIGLSPAVVEATAKANPFSPMRRNVPADPGQSGGGGDTPPTPVQPQFIYKGRLMLGTSKRAVVEEAVSRKTHFLEVGQEVAGFKVLDISEGQVILSDPRTGSEIVLGLKKPGASK